jgi:endo-1,4-beta-xylanase
MMITHRIYTFLLLPLIFLPAESYAASLRELAEQNGFHYGCATTARLLTSDPAFSAAVARECDVFTPEVDLKMAHVAVAPGVWDFRDADRLLFYAQTHGMEMRGHTLVWGQSVPVWVQGLSPFVLRDFLVRHIQTVMSRYPQIRSWDVVNEPLEPGFWGQVPDYIALALHTAHQANPAAQLMLNEPLELSADRQRRMLSLVTGLLSRGVPLHAVGVEAHLPSGPVSFEGFSAFCRKIRGLGLDMLVTELDVQGTDDYQVARAYRAFTSAALGCGIKTIITWGLSDRYTWLTGWRPLPLDAHLQPKSAYSALVSVFTRGTAALQNSSS